MPKKVRERSALYVRRLKRPGLHSVGGVAGLYLQVKESGARSWILRVKVGERRPDIGLGGYPDVTLEAARERAREARELIRQGIDPLEARKTARAALMAAKVRQMTFDDAAAACYKSKAHEFRNRKHSLQWKSTLDTYASPLIGSIAIDQIEVPHVLKVLEPIWTTKTETASRLRGRVEAVLAWATVGGFRSGDNPARWRGNLEHALAKPSRVRKVKHHRALPWQEVGAYMAELRQQDGMGARALEFLILTAARSGEARNATWDEIDFDAKLWTIPADRMKAGKIHRVPLSVPASKLLKTLPRFDDSEYVFAAARGGPLSDMSLTAVLRRMNVNAVPHGFRSTFKDWCRSSTAYPDEVSELALAHVSSDATRAAYARDELLPQRLRLMRDWARFCGLSKKMGEVAPLRSSKRAAQRGK